MSSSIFVKLFVILGEIPDPYYLVSEYYVPDRLMKRINNVTISMIESGLDKFFKSYTAFVQMMFRAKYVEDDVDALQPLTLQQLKRPMLFIVSLYGVATIVFMLEKSIEIITIIWIKWKIWRNRT